MPGSGQDASSRGAPMAVTHGEMALAWSHGDAMSRLARETGGAFLENSNDLLKGHSEGLRRRARGVCISLRAYECANGFEVPHISVQVKQKKLHVAAKAGYWALP